MSSSPQTFCVTTQCRMSSNVVVECRMSRMVRKRLEPCQKSLQRLSDIALWERKRKKENEGQSDMGENNGAHRNPLCTHWFSKKRALCHVRTEQNRTVNSTALIRKISFESGKSCVVLVFCVQGRSCPRRTTKLSA